MDNIIELLTSKEVIVVYVVIVVTCLLCFIIYLVDRNQDKRKRKQNTKELKKLVDDVNKANDALEKTGEENGTNDVIDETSPMMVADGVDVVDNDFTVEIPLGPIHEEQKAFMPEPSDLQAYNSFAEDLNDDGPVREEQMVVTDNVYNNVPTEDVVPIMPENNMVLDQMNIDNNALGAAPAVSVPIEDITISDNTTVPERERIEEIVYTNAEPTEEEATRELQKITEELEKAARGEMVEANPLDAAIPENVNVPVEEVPPMEEKPVEEQVVEQAMENIVEPEDIQNTEQVAVPEEVADTPSENITEEVANDNAQTEEVSQENAVQEEIPVPNIPEPVEEEPIEEITNKEEVNEVQEENVEDTVEEATEETKVEEVSETTENSNIDVAAYESEQEENAIISLEELTRKSEEMYAANEETQYADEGDEPISLDDLERRKQKIVNSEINHEVEETSNEESTEELDVEETEETLEELIEEKKTHVEELETEQLSFDDSYEDSKRKFKSSPVISPVFGFDRNDSISNIERIEQKKKADAFLEELKDLQNRLNAR